MRKSLLFFVGLLLVFQFSAYADEEKEPEYKIEEKELGVLRGKNDFHSNVLFDSGERSLTKVGNWETGGHYEVIIVELLSETETKWHVHKIGYETFIILEGAIKMLMKDGSEFTARKGDILFTPPNVPHKPIALEMSKVAIVTYPGHGQRPDDPDYEAPPEETDFWELEE